MPDQYPPLIRALERIDDRALAEAMLGFYLRQPDEQRALLHPLLERHRETLAAHLGSGEDLDAVTRVVLGTLLGDAPGTTAARLTELPDHDRVRAIGELIAREQVMRMLPWERWLATAPEVYGPVAAEFAARIGLRELADSFRTLLETQPEPYLVRTLGELGDRESVPLLVGFLDQPRTALEPIILESLGRIGGPRARQALRAATAAGVGPRQRMAFRALARCATEEDDQVFREAIGHQDWYVRLSCAEVLGRFSRPENLAALAQLAADPVPIVAQRALSYLET